MKYKTIVWNALFDLGLLTCKNAFNFNLLKHLSLQ